MVQKHFLVTGRVQGVGFRVFTLQKAIQLGIQGWVRNLDDGRVEVLAVGPEGAMNRFSRELQKGPQRSSVEDLSESDFSGTIDFTGFKILEDGREPWPRNLSGN